MSSIGSVDTAQKNHNPGVIGKNRETGESEAQIALSFKKVSEGIGSLILGAVSGLKDLVAGSDSPESSSPSGSTDSLVPSESLSLKDAATESLMKSESVEAINPEIEPEIAKETAPLVFDIQSKVSELTRSAAPSLEGFSASKTEEPINGLKQKTGLEKPDSEIKKEIRAELRPDNPTDGLKEEVVSSPGILAGRTPAPKSKIDLESLPAMNILQRFGKEIPLEGIQLDRHKATVADSRIANIDFMKGKDPKADLVRLLDRQDGPLPDGLKMVQKGLLMRADSEGLKNSLQGMTLLGSNGNVTGGISEAKGTSSSLSLFSMDAAGAQKIATGEWAPVAVKPNTPQWGKELAGVLGDRLNMQINQNVKEATIRLDPPEMGRLDLSVRMDGDKISVTIGSNNPQIREMLSQHMERLRLDLAQQNGQVDVQVSHGNESKKGSNSESGPGKNDNSQGKMDVSSDDGALPESFSSTSVQDKSHWLNTKA
jgi:flagellar hook-length control protein FliK